MMKHKNTNGFRQGFSLAVLMLAAAFAAVSCLFPTGIEVAGLHKQASVVLDLGGADTDGYQIFLEPGSSGTVAPPAVNPVRQGYSFGGWYTDDTWVTPFDFANTVITHTTVVYAKWNEIRWMLNFLYNDGTDGEYGRQSVLNGYYALWASSPSRSGYGFAGWYTNAACTTPFTFDQPVLYDQNLYAKWDGDNRYIHYSTNYTGGLIISQGFPMGYILTAGAVLEAPMRAGYDFGGWYETPECAGNPWAGGTITADKSVYAKWQAKSYTVTFIKSAGSNETYAVTVEHGAPVPHITPDQLVNSGNAAAGSTLIPSGGWSERTGWGFIRWECGGAAWNFGTSVTSDVELTGVWAQNRYTVTLERMDGTAPLTIPDINAGETPDIPPYTRAGYAFDGWYTTVNYSTPYTAGPLYRDITLYAKWNAQNYTVTFDPQGGSAGLSYQVTHGGRAVPPVIPPTKAGSNFVGWSETQGGSPADFTSAAAVITGTRTFYALWTQLATYTVTFDLNGGVLPGLTNPSIVDGQPVPAPAGAPTRENHTFKGWYTAASGGSAWNFTTPVTEPKTIYAQWTSNAASPVSPSNYVAILFRTRPWGPDYSTSSGMQFALKLGSETILSQLVSHPYNQLTIYVPHGSTLAMPNITIPTKSNIQVTGSTPAFPLTVTGPMTIELNKP
jgi:uncharacterized repeat protein (TIGR02543 family)